MKKFCSLLVGFALTLYGALGAGFFYGTPAGGWNYLFDGDQTNGLGTCKPTSSLDGTWNSNNGSSEWDGSWRGAGNGMPGGISSDGTTLTMEDINNGSGSCNNRKLYFTHDLAQDSGLVNPGSIVDGGVTLFFRARLPTVDPLAEIALPDGWGIFSDGKANFNIRQTTPSSIIGFSLVRQSEPDSSHNYTAAGLTMNRLNGDSPAGSGAVNSSGTASNNQVLPLDPTQWHEFWITIQANDATPGNGTHTVTIYVDGSITPNTFNVTAGTGSDASANYIAMGLNNSTGEGCFETDFFGYKQGVFAPVLLTPPPAPTNVVAVAGDMQVSLSWDEAPGASAYIVKGATMSGGPYIDLATVTTNSYTDGFVVNGTTYYYVIQATNSAGASPESAEVSATPNVAVTGLTATGGTNQIALSWNTLATATSYNVLRSDSSGGSFTTIATGVATTSYTDTLLPDGQTFYYVVTAELTGGGQATRSNEASATTAPSAPTLTASLFASTAAQLDWTSSDLNVGQFIIENATDGMNFSQVATADGSARSTIITGLNLDSTNTFRIKATTDGGESDYSNTATVVTPVFGVNVNFANSTFATNFPGYLNDYGLVYADRGNGYTYGWDLDNTANARERNSTNSLDKRYDTLNHVQKPLPAGRIWEIAIPNGFYEVHIVAGDPDNQDSVFQFDVEGVLTDSYTPTAGARFGDFTVTAVVSDGILTVTNGPAASNNKIAFIDIVSAVPVAPVIATDPQSQTVETTHPATLSVTLSQGSTPLTYEWYHDNMLVTGATGPILSFDHVQLSDAGDYFVIVTNYGGMVTSATATLTVLQDTNPPMVLSVGSLDGRTIGICFNEELDQATAEDEIDYTVNGGTANVTNAVLRPDRHSVELTVDPPVAGTFTVNIAGVGDLSSNYVSFFPGVTVTQTVAEFVVGDVGTPSLPGSHFTCDNETIEIIGGGSDIWGTSDNGYFVTREVTDDFDASVRVTGLVGVNAITKAVIAARESRNADAAAFHISVNPPPPGRDQVELGLRSTTGGSTASWGSTFVPAGIPDIWIRITRVGDTFTGYRSTNGVDWIPMGTNTLALSSFMHVGIGVTAHDDTQLSTGTFTDLKIIDSPDLFNQTYSGGTFSASFFSASGVSYEVQYKDSLSDPMWTTLTTIAGDGTVLSFTDSGPLPAMRFYRIIAQ